MFTDFYVPVILIASIFLMLFLCYRFQKKAVSLPDELCVWSKSYWITNTGIRVSKLNELTSAGIPNENSNLVLLDWLIGELGRPIKPCDTVSIGDLKFLVTHYRDRGHNKIYVYPQKNGANI